MQQATTNEHKAPADGEAGPETIEDTLGVETPKAEYADLAAIIRGEYELPPVRYEIMVAGKRHSFIGHYGQGKTVIATWVAIQHVKDGGDIWWFDCEMGEVAWTQRAAEAGLTVEMVDGSQPGRVRFVAHPDLDENGEGMAPYLADFRAAVEAADADGRPRPLAVFDSVAMFAMGTETDEDRNTEIMRWSKANIDPLWHAGGTTLGIGHVRKSADRNDRQAERGAGIKSYQADVIWYVEWDKEPDRTTAGSMRLTRFKDRTVQLDREVYMTVGDGKGGLPIKRAGQDKTAPENPRERLIHEIRMVLMEHARGRDKALTTTGVYELVGGRKSRVIDALAKVPDASFRVDPHAKLQNGRKGTVYWYEPGSYRHPAEEEL